MDRWRSAWWASTLLHSTSSLSSQLLVPPATLMFAYNETQQLLIMHHFLSCPFTVPLQLNVLTLQISLQAHLFSHSGLSGWPVRDSSSILPCRPLLPSPPTTVHSLVPAKEISYLVNSKWPYYLTDKVNIESLWHFQGQAVFKTPGKSCYMLYSTIF